MGARGGSRTRRRGSSGLRTLSVLAAATLLAGLLLLFGLEPPLPEQHDTARVAEELGTGPASLYWHVANKDQLLNVLLDRVIGEVPLPEPDPERWEEQLRAFAHEGRAAFGRHRDLARASLGRVPIGPNLLRVTDWLLALLRGAGVPPRPAAWFGDIFALYVAAHAFEESITDDGGAEHSALEHLLEQADCPYRAIGKARLRCGAFDVGAAYVEVRGFRFTHTAGTRMPAFSETGISHTHSPTGSVFISDVQHDAGPPAAVRGAEPEAMQRDRLGVGAPPGVRHRRLRVVDAGRKADQQRGHDPQRADHSSSRAWRIEGRNRQGIRL